VKEKGQEGKGRKEGRKEEKQGGRKEEKKGGRKEEAT
jgi:hypothetical protein